MKNPIVVVKESGTKLDMSWSETTLVSVATSSTYSTYHLFQIDWHLL